MFKVLLVDDELFVRRGLQKLIRWEQFKCTLVGEAKNGGEALEMIKRLEPDLVITDIMMPVLDGLDLIKNVKAEARADPEFIIISGYNDFRYAQQAIKYGVKDYILKPIDVRELGATLLNLQSTIIKKRLSALTNGYLSASSILEALIHEELDEKNMAWYAEVLGINEQSGFLYIWALFQAAPGQSRIQLKDFQKLLAGWGNAWDLVPVFEHMPGQFGMLWGAEHLKCWGSEALDALEAARNEICTNLKQEVTLYAGDIMNRLPLLKQSYLGANEALKHRFAEEGKCVILHEQIKNKALYLYDMDVSVADLLMVKLEENDKDACMAVIDIIFRSFCDQRYTPSAVIRSLSLFNTRVMEIIKQMHGTYDEQRGLLDTLEKEASNWSLRRLKEHFTQMVTEAAEYIDHLRKAQSKGDIERIKKYIDSHYSENINLKTIAAQFYLNSAYLGQLFRKTYGIYFNDYLLELRVAEAKKLLRQTDLRMYEIAVRVGIPVSNYFVTQFEKLEKCSPLEYRNSLVKRE
jgi:two-component system, response regulator YesN